METTLRGLTTVSFYANDLEAAKNWYSEFLNKEPYFNVPGYIEFRIGDYQHELGIIDSKFAPNGATKTRQVLLFIGTLIICKKRSKNFFL